SEKAAQWVKRAADEGARLVCFPENCLYMGAPGEKPPALSLSSPEILHFVDLAHGHDIEILLGSIPLEGSKDEKPANTSVLIYPRSPGKAVAPEWVTYRKIHLFDVTLPSGDSHCESQPFTAGDSIVTAHTRAGTLGMTICYDLRFPELYRQLV